MEIDPTKEQLEMALAIISGRRSLDYVPFEVYSLLFPEIVKADGSALERKPSNDEVKLRAERYVGTLLCKLISPAPNATPLGIDTASHQFVVDVIGCTREQADQVMAERIGPDEDYGFEYQIDYNPLGSPSKEEEVFPPLLYPPRSPVWIMQGDRPKQGVVYIASVMPAYGAAGDLFWTYTVWPSDTLYGVKKERCVTLRESDVFPSKEALLASLA